MIKKSRNRLLIILVSVFFAAICIFAACFLITDKPARADGSFVAINNIDGTGKSITYISQEDGFTKLSGLDGWGKRVNTSADIGTHGLTVSIKVKNYDGKPFGFGFTKTSDGYSPVSDMFNATVRSSENYNFLYYQNDHTGEAYDPPHDIAYVNSDLSVTAYGIDGSRKYAFDKSEELGFTLKFETEDLITKITITNISNLARYNSDEAYLIRYYVPEKAYLCFWGLDGNSSDIYVKYTSGEDKTYNNDQYARGKDLDGEVYSEKPTVIKQEDGYLKISGLNDWHYPVNTSEKIKIDGLTVYFKVNNYDGYPIGFGLIEKQNTYAAESGLFNGTVRTLNKKTYLYYQFDDTGETITKPHHNIAFSDEALTKSDYGEKGQPKYAFTDNSEFGFKITFKKQGDIYKITTEGISNFGEYNSNVCYVSKDYIPEEAYLSVWGHEGDKKTVFVMAKSSESEKSGCGSVISSDLGIAFIFAALLILVFKIAEKRRVK